MNGLLVRVGIDQTAGEWNCPVDSKTREFVYVTIPEYGFGLKRGLKRKYDEFTRPLSKFGDVLPRHLRGLATHLDPDFFHLTYGDQGPKGKQISRLVRGDIIAFYAGMRADSIRPGSLVYALIGLYVVDELVRGRDVPRSRWHENAHTRRASDESDVIVRAKPGLSGRLTRCIPIGEYRDRAYRVRRDLLKAWGGLSVRDGYITRSGRIPRFTDAGKFYAWFRKQRPRLIRKNN
jgi:hypothetical protein